MKLLDATILLSIISNFSLHSMNIIRQKTHNSLTHRTIKHSVLKKNYMEIILKKNLHSLQKKISSPAFKKKTLQFCKKPDMNNIATAGNMLAACSTGNPFCLLQALPHLMHRAAGYTQEHKIPSTKFDQDLKQLIYNNPSIIKHLKTIDEIDQKINSFQNFKCTEISKHYNDKIFNLEQKKKEIMLTIINKSKPLFQSYNNVNISTYIQNKTLNLELNKKTSSWNQKGDLLCAFTLVLGIPNLFNALAISSIPASIAIAFSMILAFGRLETVECQKELDEMSQQDENTIKILKIYQAYKNTNE